MRTVKVFIASCLLLVSLRAAADEPCPGGGIEHARCEHRRALGHPTPEAIDRAIAAYRRYFREHPSDEHQAEVVHALEELTVLAVWRPTPPSPAPRPAPAPAPPAATTLTFDKPPPRRARKWVVPVAIVVPVAAIGLVIGLSVGLTHEGASLGSITYPGAH